MGRKSKRDVAIDRLIETNNELVSEVRSMCAVIRYNDKTISELQLSRNSWKAMANQQAEIRAELERENLTLQAKNQELLGELPPSIFHGTFDAKQPDGRYRPKPKPKPKPSRS